MFVNVHDFPFTSHLQDNWSLIRAEYESIPAKRLVHWPERDLYDFGWRAFPLVALGQAIPPNAEVCPQTMQLLKSIPTLVNAGFSLFGAGTHVHPHVGYTSSVLRFHLGLKVPDRCGLKVANEVRRWEEGKLLAFDDMVEHSAWNDSDEDRAILLFDVLKPGARLEITASAAQAVQDIVDLVRVAS
jgi:aspartyl/asparaginyl beta-hydroxylase (cupin superfamily)